MDNDIIYDTIDHLAGEYLWRKAMAIEAYDHDRAQIELDAQAYADAYETMRELFSDYYTFQPYYALTPCEDHHVDV